MNGTGKTKETIRTFNAALDALKNAKPRLNRQNFAVRTIKRGAGRKVLSLHSEMEKRGDVGRMQVAEPKEVGK